YARFIGTRDLVGRIEILDFDKKFNVISNREGVEKNESYHRLTNQKNGYFFKTFRRLEKYIVDGLEWDSIPEEDRNKISEIEKKIISGQIDENDLLYREDDITKKRRVYETIHSIISAKADNVIELYINEDLILNKIEEEKLNAEREFEQLISDFENKKIDGETLNRILQKKALDNKDLEKQINDLSKYNTNDATTKAIAELQSYKSTIEKQTKIIEELKFQLEKERIEKEEQYKLIEDLKSDKEKAEIKVKDAEIKIVEAERETEKVREEKNKIEEELLSEQKKGSWQGALIGTDKERIIGLQHQIFHSSSRINRNIKLLLKHLNPNSIDDTTKKYISVMSLEASKINSIANFVTKANFNLKASEIKKDLVEFIDGYLNEVYISENKIIDSGLKINITVIGSFEFIKEIRPLEITTLIDSFISNSEKAGADSISFVFSKKDENLKIEIIDNGFKTIDKDSIMKIFDLGYTTTNGTGIGLYQARDIVNRMNGEIKAESEKGIGTKFIITL
ncbi:MAG: ATP-binding protein, partial [Flavobacterium sp.]|nr:ATP-binding protein [Flavobacterium sp.]